MAGKHIVTIEGLNDRDHHALNPIQEAIVAEGASQCGCCTPGIVVALTGFFLAPRATNAPFDERQAIAAVGGNICRCTGYQSIKRAIMRLCRQFSRPDASDSDTHIHRLVDRKILLPYFLDIPHRLRKLPHPRGDAPSKPSPETIIVGGGTNLWVAEPGELYQADLIYLSRQRDLKGIRVEKDRCYMGAMTTFQEIEDSPVMQGLFPRIREYFQRMASPSIRGRGTVGGNIVNASPRGDLSVFFLALGTRVLLNNGENRRELALEDFFTGHEQLEDQDEILEGIHFSLPPQEAFFHFEKVSRRAHFDAACVNSAIQMTVDDGVIRQIRLSAGGVAPIPLYLSDTTDYLTDREITPGSIREAGSIAQAEISPTGDARGSADYKRLLLRQLIYAHFITLFPERVTLEALR
uniref:Xanthine dehydrogenase small subunit n=1 Tax=Candidatus Kentrum eta TaxID=2126337 RepID=A0A450V684_9GAMM|nr:MAG: xanthine dehydrogenase small subunit [Candidatus Kentron sp. H]VFJ93437.1 MAG: xanthine dehydrogenase small subunit [Candidatus Kentron sp. H]VFK00313.1 MAG: xanthine dehydrogenase small subunit [Candidatus Kentron sp. H]